MPGYAVRAGTEADLPACNRLCQRVHGFERAGELAEAVARGGAQVVERAGRITGYATALAFFGHSVGETDEDLMALIGAAPAFGGPGLLVPTRNGVLMRWCLARGLRVTQTLTLMSMGLYSEPAGAWLPSGGVLRGRASLFPPQAGEVSQSRKRQRPLRDDGGNGGPGLSLRRCVSPLPSRLACSAPQATPPLA